VTTDVRRERSQLERALHATLVTAREVALTLLQVGLFFGVFLLILQLSLPRGTGLQAVYADVASGRRERGAVALSGDTAYDLGPVATLTAVNRSVKDRPADGIAWHDSAPGMELQDHHAIQTMARSGATITFQDDNRLWLDENSLVVIQRPTKGPARSRRASLTVLGGRVRGSVRPAGGKDGGKARALDVELVGGPAQIRSSATGEATEFSVQVNADQSSTLAVLSGLAEIERAGRTVRLGPQEALTIDPAGVAGEPVRIPDPPSLRFPDDGLVHTEGPSTPSLEFRWDALPGADAYRLVIARDAEFTDVAFDSRSAATVTRPANLGPGRYFWRVSALAGESEGAPGETRTFEIVGDTTAPALTVDLPAGPVSGDRLVVHGTAEPGSRVLIGSRAVTLAPDGSFEHELELAPGPNLIVIEAVDPAGNVTYRSQYVYAKNP